MNRRNFFKAAGAVMVGGLVGAQVQARAPKYTADLGELVEMLPGALVVYSSAHDDLALRLAREDEDRALRLERMRQDHQAQLDEARRIDAMRLAQVEEEFDRQFARMLERIA